jgi:hypothetical protein
VIWQIFPVFHWEKLGKIARMSVKAKRAAIEAGSGLNLKFVSCRELVRAFRALYATDQLLPELRMFKNDFPIVHIEGLTICASL